MDPTAAAPGMVQAVPDPLTMAQMASFVLTAILSWLLTKLLKHVGDGSQYATLIRRALPLVAPFVGAALNAGLAAFGSGYPWWQGALWGLVAGACATWGQEAASATLGGDVNPSRRLTPAEAPRAAQGQ